MAIPDVIHCPHCFRWQRGCSGLNSHTCTACGVVFSPVELTASDKLAYLKASMSAIQLRYVHDVIMDEAKDWGAAQGFAVRSAARVFTD